MMIALSGLDEVSPTEQSWLAAHLASCPACREFAENSRATIHALRGIPITASRSLVSATQMRVRQRAADLHRQQERLWMVCACCAAVTICSAATTLAMWHGLGWIAQQLQIRLSPPLLEYGFLVFSWLPAVLAGMFLLARGTFLADHGESASRGAV
jgi:anti-sigma factor RsiW